MKKHRPHAILLSFHYAKANRFDRPGVFEKTLGRFTTPPHFFIDSGAFSARSLGASIDIGEYCEFLREHQNRIDVYANLDVINDGDATLINQRDMERRGLRPIPVFHTGVPFKFFERYCEEYDYIALGGAAGLRGQKVGAWFVRCFRHIERIGRPIKLHGFGITTATAMTMFPWHSCDSSTWAAAYRFARLSLFNPITGKWRNARAFTDEVISAASLIRRYGGDPQVFINRKLYSHGKNAEMIASSWKAFEMYIRERKGRENFRIYFADSNFKNHRDANVGISRLFTDTGFKSGVFNHH